MKKIIITLSCFFFFFSLAFTQTDNTLPFFDDFNNDYANWTTFSVNGSDEWHLSGEDGIDGSKCAWFYVFSNPVQANDDWLVSKAFNTKGISNVAIEFKYRYNRDGAVPEFYYTSVFDGNPSNSQWTKLDNSFWIKEWTWNDGRIEFEIHQDSLFFAFRYQSLTEKISYVLIDNFNIKSYEPIVMEKFGESQYFEFYSEASNSNYWDTISASVDNWFNELCSYWDRPQTNPLFNEGEKVKIYLTDKNQIDEQIGIISPDWKFGNYKLPNEIYVAIPHGGKNDIYEGSFIKVVKNSLSQLVLKKRNNRDLGGYLTDYYSEAFGLYQSGYRANRDSIILAINNLGRLPLLSDIENTNGINNTYKKDLVVSFIESQILAESYQLLHYGNEERWQNHLKYFYQADEDKRMGLTTSSSNFDIYSIQRDTIYNTLTIQKLEELFISYTSLFELNIYNRFNVVIYPDIETATEMNGGYSMGSAQGGDLFNMLSPHTAEDPMAAAVGGLINHEFWHIIHFHMRPYNGFPGGYFIMEGMARYMTRDPIDMQNVQRWKVEELFYDYSSDYGREPTLMDIMENPQTYDPYFFGQMFYNYLIPNIASHIDLKKFFLGRCDWSALNKSYEEIDRGYIHFIKSLVNYTPPDSLTSIPFEEPFNDFFNGWIKPNFNNPDNWQIAVDRGFNGGNCAIFYTYSDLNEPIESWLISPPFNTENTEQINLSFDFMLACEGEGIELEVFYTNSFKGYTDSTNWTSAKKITMPSDWWWSNSGEITISNPPDTVFIGLRKKSTGEQYLQLYIDNFEVKELLPLETLNATDINHNSSTLNALATSNFYTTVTQHGFYWSQTNSPPTATDNVEIVAGTTQEYSFQLTGLLPETTYYFRAFATNTDRTVLGEVMQFATLDDLEYVDLPFFDDFENEYESWSSSNIAGADVWHISGDDGIDLSKCARFYIRSNPQQSNDDWLLTPLFNTNGISNIQISFKYLYHGDGFIPEFYYSNSYDGNLSNSTWTQIDNSFWQNMLSWNDALIEIENPGNPFVFAIRYQSTVDIHNYILIDDFRIEGTTTNTLESVLSVYNFKIYPNPLTHESIISFKSNANEKVNISIYDMNGRNICTLLDKKLYAGMHQIKVENQMLTNGVYLCKLATSKGISTLKLVVAK
ncbi:MAG: choice-of-anchor J domain-containing protein [Prolixibacteraceae bacterium]|jgi:hypothetical protein|nr:choice-of-anchor J domain-containing protein [Prolixibacteraceae bacterium]